MFNELIFYIFVIDVKLDVLIEWVDILFNKCLMDYLIKV